MLVDELNQYSLPYQPLIPDSDSSPENSQILHLDGVSGVSKGNTYTTKGNPFKTSAILIIGVLLSLPRPRC